MFFILYYLRYFFLFSFFSNISDMIISIWDMKRFFSVSDKRWTSGIPFICIFNPVSFFFSSISCNLYLLSLRYIYYSTKIHRWEDDEHMYFFCYCIRTYVVVMSKLCCTYVAVMFLVGCNYGTKKSQIWEG